MNRRKPGLLSVLLVLLAVVVVAAGCLDLFLDIVIPGLLPISMAALMFGLIPLYGGKQGRAFLYSVLFAATGILNLVSGVLQIVNS